MSSNTQIRHPCSKIPNQPLLVPKLGIIFSPEVLHLDKFDGADFKYGNSLLIFWPKNSQIRLFWCQIRGMGADGCKNLQLEKFQGADLKHDKSFFLKKIPFLKDSSKAFLFKNTQSCIFCHELRHFVFSIIFSLISNMKLVF